MQDCAETSTLCCEEPRFLINNVRCSVVPHEQCAAPANRPNWSVACVTTAGSSHTRSNCSYQDYHQGVLINGAAGEWIILAVADGAGSATYSRVGAEIATKVLCDVLVGQIANGDIEPFPNYLGRRVVAEVQDALKTEAENGNVQLRDFACTLLGAAIGPEQVAYLQLGDGAIVRRGAHGWEAIEWPQRGEYANTTHFVTDEDAADHITFKSESLVLPSFGSGGATSRREHVIFTDGIQDLVLDRGAQKPHARFFDFVFQEWRTDAVGGVDERQSSRLQQLLDSQQLRSRTDDDLTIAAVMSLGDRSECT